MFGPVNAGAIAIQSGNLDLIRFGWTIPTVWIGASLRPAAKPLIMYEAWRYPVAAFQPSGASKRPLRFSRTHPTYAQYDYRPAQMASWTMLDNLQPLIPYAQSNAQLTQDGSQRRWKGSGSAMRSHEK